jgi:hypothetical protein
VLGLQYRQVPILEGGCGMTEFAVSIGPVPARDFQIVTNAFLRGKLPVPLRATARCLLGYFLSLPESGWQMSREQLDRSMVEGRDAVSSGLRELETAGYLHRERISAGKSSWRWVWHITDDPIARPLTGFTSTENPSTKPTGENGAKPQVVSSTGKSSPENPSIVEEGFKKTDQEDPASKLTGQSALFQAVPEAVPETKDSQEKKPLTLNQRATRLAQEHYERLGKTGNVPAFMKIIRRALENDFADQSVSGALAFIAENNWTLTGERLRNTLLGGPKRPTHSPTAAVADHAAVDGRGRPVFDSYGHKIVYGHHGEVLDI